MKTAVNKTGSSVFYHTFPLGHNPTNRSNAFSAGIQPRGVNSPLKTAPPTPLPHPRHPRKTLEIQELIALLHMRADSPDHADPGCRFKKYTFQSAAKSAYRLYTIS
jgi:hypothetical protein